jgi:hypothetical protein
MTLTVNCGGASVRHPCGFGSVWFFQKNVCQHCIVCSWPTYIIPQSPSDLIGSAQHSFQVQLIHWAVISYAFCRYRHCLTMRCSCFADNSVVLYVSQSLIIVSTLLASSIMSCNNLSLSQRHCLTDSPGVGSKIFIASPEFQ